MILNSITLTVKVSKHSHKAETAKDQVLRRGFMEDMSHASHIRYSANYHCIANTHNSCAYKDVFYTYGVYLRKIIYLKS